MKSLSRRDLFKGSAAAVAISATDIQPISPTIIGIDLGLCEQTTLAFYDMEARRQIAEMAAVMHIPARYLIGEFPAMEESDARLLTRFHERLPGDA